MQQWKWLEIGEIDRETQTISNGREIRAVHDNVRPHVCQFCFKAFHSKQNRLCHEFTHRSPVPVPILNRGGYTGKREETAVPRLTDLLVRCKDTGLRPYCKVVMVYMWPFPSGDDVILPALKGGKGGEQGKLPGFGEVEGKRGK